MGHRGGLWEGSRGWHTVNRSSYRIRYSLIILRGQGRSGGNLCFARPAGSRMSRRPGAHGAHASASEKERVNSIFKADGTTQYLLDMREFSSDGAPAISSWLVRSLGHKYATIEPTQEYPCSSASSE